MKNQNLLALFGLLLASPMAVIASSETDGKIEDAAKASYNYRTVLDNNVKVKAHDGVVTLSGTVQDKDDKALAADTVENLPGVSGVKNDIVVKSAYPETSDGWIALKIRSRLLLKGNVSATSTTVTSKDGAVTLSGSTDNLAQDVRGTKSVKNDMTVEL